MKSSILVATLICAWNAFALPFNGFQVFRVKTESEDAAASLNTILKDLNLETWLKPTRNQFADVVVPPSALGAFQQAISGFNTQTMIANLSEAVLNSQVSEPASSMALALESAKVPDSWFDSYHKYSEHLQFLQALNRAYPKKTRIVQTGRSFEGRDIVGLHIFNPNVGPARNPAVIWHSTVHAREWITGMTVEYAMVRLLDPKSDAATKKLVQQNDFYIFPFVNPDGFVYSQLNPATRLWRKNRQPVPLGIPVPDLELCRGTDINRNWPYKWDVPGGSSTNPCDEDYRGPSAGSTPEMKGLTKFILNTHKNQGVRHYMDFHSYSQLLMFPYGYTCDMLPVGLTGYQKQAAAFKRALGAVYGTNYTTGPICPTIYQTSGGSTDWVQDIAKANYAFAAELRDTGKYGFLLPPDQIRPSGIETWAGLKALLTTAMS